MSYTAWHNCHEIMFFMCHSQYCGFWAIAWQITVLKSDSFKEKVSQSICVVWALTSLAWQIIALKLCFYVNMCHRQYCGFWAAAWQITGLKSYFIDGILLRISEAWHLMFFSWFFSHTCHGGCVFHGKNTKSENFDRDSYWPLLPDFFP